MNLAVNDANRPAPHLFRQMVVANSRYWLQRAQDEPTNLLPETPQVLKALHYALALPEAWLSARDLLLRLTPLMIRQGQGQVWEELLAKGIAQSSGQKDPAEIEFRLHLGNLYRLQGRLSEAQSCLQEALTLCNRHQRRKHYCMLMNYLGLVARLSGRHDEALAYCQKALREPGLAAAEKAETFNVMGLVAHDQRHWAEALDYFGQALVLSRSLGDSYQIARILTNQGVALRRSKRLDEAEKHYREAIQWFEVSGDQTERFKVVMNLGNILLMKKAYAAAIEQYQAALPVFQRYNYVVDLAHTYNNLGMAYTGLARWQTAESYFEASLEVWRNIGDVYNLANVLDNFGDMLIKAGRPEQAGQILSQALRSLAAEPDSPATARLRQFIEKRLNRLDVDSQG